MILTYLTILGYKNRPKVSHVIAEANDRRVVLTIAWNSPRSFCMGVPERMIRLVVDRASNMVEVLLFADLRR